jgi:hypothetical protein
MNSIKYWLVSSLLFIFVNIRAQSAYGQTEIDGDITASTLTVTGPVTMSSITVSDTLVVSTLNVTGFQTGITLGKVKQIVEIYTETTFATTSQTFQSTNLTGSITPTSSTSNIMVCMHTIGIVNNGGNILQGSIFRGATDIFGTGSPGFQLGSGSGSIRAMLSVCKLDSPATTSATNYTAKILSTTAGQSVTFGNGQSQIMDLVEYAP